MNFCNGPWKEGRLGASTLCYLNPRADQIPHLVAHHRAVGIRATIAFSNPALPAQTADLRSLNWDLAILDSPNIAETQAAIQSIGARVPGLFTGSTPSLPGAAYIVTTQSGTLPRTATPGLLPSLAAPSDLQTLTQTTWDIATRHEWVIWRIDEHALDALGDSAHAELLHWLGERHDRVYCAPVWDVCTWQLANP